METGVLALVLPLSCEHDANSDIARKPRISGTKEGPKASVDQWFSNNREFSDSARLSPSAGLIEARTLRDPIIFQSFQNSCNHAYFFLQNAFPEYSGHLLGLLHGCCTDVTA